MERYGTLTKDGELPLQMDSKTIYTKTVTDETLTKSAPSGMKPVRYADVPKYDQELEAVYQEAPVDTGEEITVGVRIEILPEDDQKYMDDLPVGIKK
jgi:serine/threonine protein kinase HipA of HipAB toxin-antitoxin module